MLAVPHTLFGSHKFYGFFGKVPRPVFGVVVSFVLVGLAVLLAVFSKRKIRSWKLREWRISGELATRFVGQSMRILRLLQLLGKIRGCFF